VTVRREAAEELRARFLELAPEGFEELEHGEDVELAAYGAAAMRVVEQFPDARQTEVESGWEHRWREFHRPVRVGPLWVGPPWEVPPADALPVVIDPGLAFGTGAHPTTRLCLELLVELERGSLLDVGCGSGVLGIAAVRLGYEPVIAIDVERAAVDVTRANAAANGAELETRLLDALADPLPGAQTAVANIALHAVTSLGPRLHAERVVTSGYLAADRPELQGYGHVDRRQLEGWAADLYERRG
jgi:ribosomal protein L11 methyltransferase